MQLIAPLSMAGAERVVQMLSSSLDRERFETSICAFVNHRRISNSFTEAIDRHGLQLDRILLKHLFGLKPVCELVKLARKCNANVFHAHGHRPDVMSYIAAKILKIPLVSTVHGSPGSVDGTKMRLYDAMDFFVLRRCDRVITVSKDTARTLQSRIDIGQKLEIIPNTIDPANYAVKNGRMRLRDELSIDPAAKVVGFLGRFSQEKGLGYLLCAMNAVLKEIPNCYCLLVGGGPLAASLKEQCSSLSISDKVYILDEVDYVRGFYESLDLLVLPSLTEGMPMVLLEAQYFGLPVVASKVGGIPERIIHAENGLLVQPGNSNELASSILRLLQNSTLAQQMGRVNQQQFAMNNNLREWTARYEDIYLSVVEAA